VHLDDDDLLNAIVIAEVLSDDPPDPTPPPPGTSYFMSESPGSAQPVAAPEPAGAGTRILGCLGMILMGIGAITVFSWLFAAFLRLL
jgi:hypothetical protein